MLGGALARMRGLPCALSGCMLSMLVSARSAIVIRGIKRGLPGPSPCVRRLCINEPDVHSQQTMKPNFTT